MNNQPAFTLRDGAIKATIWANDSEKGTFYSVDVTRSYKDKGGEWQETTSFSGSDILRAGNLYTAAYNRILQLKADEAEKA